MDQAVAEAIIETVSSPEIRAKKILRDRGQTGFGIGFFLGTVVTILIFATILWPVLGTVEHIVIHTRYL